ncbi:MAG: glutamate--tRNA ligase [Candidatus Nanoarchaeia archaeon]|jgi:glutamyl-tRNA synthetase
MNETIRKYALKNAHEHGKAILGAVMPKVIGELPESKKDIKGLIKRINEVITQVNKLSPENILNELMSQAPELLEKKEEIKGLKELPGIKGKVVMRFAPFPSGPLHIGNALPAVLNDEYAKKYKGKLILVIDDTIGSEAKPIDKAAYRLIPQGLKWLGVKFDPTIIYKSDRMELFYKYAASLIDKGAAYVCECPTELIRDYRAKSKECLHRNNTVSENKRLWKKMLSGGYDEGEACVRIKTDLKHKNPAFRDRVLLRISKRAHPKTGIKYCVWPMLEFSWAVDDHLLGITHILRGKDLYIEDEMERLIWGILGWKEPVIVHSSLVSVEGVKISKSKSSREVKSGEYTGWDDPRTWSLQSLKRRGIKPEAVRQFVLDIGLTENEVKVPVDKLYTINRRLIDAASLRYFFVKDPVKLLVSGCPEKKAVIPLHHVINKSRSYVIEKGVNTFWISESDVELLKNECQVRLKDSMNIEVKSVGKEIRAVYAKDQDEVYKIRKVQFVTKSNHECSVLKPDGLIDKGLCEDYASKVKEGEIIQFERYGFVRKEGKGKYIYTHD